MEIEEGVYEFRTKVIYKDGSVEVEYNTYIAENNKDLQETIEMINESCRYNNVADVITTYRYMRPRRIF